MKIHIEETEKGYRVCFDLNVKQGLKIISELKQFYKMKSVEGQEN